jgi:hypothetical protein
MDSKGTFDKLGIIWIAIQVYGHAFHCDRFDKGKEFFLNQSSDLVNREVKLRVGKRTEIFIENRA